MGFSVSGSAAIVLAGLFIAFGMWHSAATNSFEQVSEARADRADAALEATNVEVDLVTAFHNSDTLTLEIENEGTTTLSLNETDIIVDGEYRSDWQAEALIDDTNVSTYLWQPGEELEVQFSYGVAPARVTIATEHGVSDAMEVTT